MLTAIWRGLIGLAFVGLCACSPGRGPDPFLVLAGPGEVARLEIADEDGSTLWALEAQPPQRLDRIVYPIVPEGFEQVEPTGDYLPRPLEPGELLRVETRTRHRRFVHVGIAKTPSTMEIVNYSMEMLGGQE